MSEISTKKAVLLSLRAEWVKPIFITKEKIYEVRRRAPLLKTPYTVYVYCTKQQPLVTHENELYNGYLNGFVCGEFTCVNNLDVYPPFMGMSSGTCLSDHQLIDYACESKVVFMEIENPILYRLPLPLSVFGLSKAPQSWTYCEEI